MEDNQQYPDASPEQVRRSSGGRKGNDVVDDLLQKGMLQ